MKRARKIALALAMMVAGSEYGHAQSIQPMPEGAAAGPMGPAGADQYGGVPYADEMAYGGGPGCYGGGPGCGPGFGHGMGAGQDLWDKVHQPNRWYAGLQYVGLKMEGMSLPALVTTSPAGTAQAVAGRLPDATVLYGNQDVGDDWRSGGEVRLGWWLVDGQFLSIEGYFMATEQNDTHFNATSTFTSGNNGFILARPYFDLLSNAEDARLLAFDNFNTGNAIVDLDGSIDIDTRSEIQSGGLGLRHVLWADFERNLRFDLIGGYRFFRVDESLTIHDRSLTPPVGIVGSILDERTDLFDTENQFHGGEIGLDMQWYEDVWTFQLITKCAVGNMHEVLTIDGRRDVTSGGSTASTVGGLLAQPSNIGTVSDDQFAVIPEGMARIQYSLYNNFRIFAGYRIQYVSELLRPGDQIDRVINESQFNGGALNGASRPTTNFSSTSVWLQGLDAGIEFEW